MTKPKTTAAVLAACAAVLTVAALTRPTAHTTATVATPKPPTATAAVPQATTAPSAPDTTAYGCVTVEPWQFTGTSGDTSVMMVLDHALCLGKPTTGTVMWTCTVHGQTVTGGDTFTATATRDAVTLAMDDGAPAARLWITPPTFTLPAGALRSGPCPMPTDTTLEPGV